MGFVKEFKEFALKGNVIDLAVGLIIGLYFGAIVKSLVDDIIMPVIGLLLGGVDLSNRFVVLREGATPLLGNETVAQARAAGAVVVGYGQLLNTILTFFLVAVAVFLLVKQMNRLRRLKKTEPIEPTEKACPFCFSKIPAKATRCAHCTSDLGAGAASKA